VPLFLKRQCDRTCEKAIGDRSTWPAEELVLAVSRAKCDALVSTTAAWLRGGAAAAAAGAAAPGASGSGGFAGDELLLCSDQVQVVGGGATCTPPPCIFPYICSGST
jgi:hypothetical protein